MSIHFEVNSAEGATSSFALLDEATPLRENLLSDAKAFAATRLSAVSGGSERTCVW